MEIWDNDSYTAPVDCLINQSIYEYDIKQANISILLESGIIDESKFNYYANLPKIDREISIGLLQRDNPEIAEALKAGFIRARKALIISNSISEFEIINIRKDAIFTTRKLNKLDFGHIHFKEKNVYTSYYKIFNLVFLYGYRYMINSKIQTETYLDIKGINKESLKYHKGYLLDIFEDIIIGAERESDLFNVVNFIKNFLIDYVKLNLDLNYYREFNSESKFNIQSKNANYRLMDMQYSYPVMLNIEYNRRILERFYQILLSVAFERG